MSFQAQMIEHEDPNSINMAELRQRWSRIKIAINEMLHVYHSSGDSEDDRLEEICDYFEQKVDFDSPLAIEE